MLEFVFLLYIKCGAFYDMVKSGFTSIDYLLVVLMYLEFGFRDV